MPTVNQQAPSGIRVVNWNTEFLSPRSRSDRFDAVRQVVADRDPDIVCLTEAYPEAMPTGGYTVVSDSSGRGGPEARGARKVVLWSRHGWEAIDRLGSPRLPEGRFVSATTRINGRAVHVVGVCIPYRDYRTRASWGEHRHHRWEGAHQYLTALRDDVLSTEAFASSTVLLGDFNLQIPPRTYPRPTEPINHHRERTFRDWNIPTAGEHPEAGLDKPFIDHVALTPDWHVAVMTFIHRFRDGHALSDHNGVRLTLK